ncbi:MAG: hypothetical protein WD055_05355 [Candidatus Dependentiae bacterium]
MRNTKNRYFILFVAVFSYSWTQAANYLPNSYNGVAITPHTVYGLMPPIDTQLESKINIWLQNNSSLVDQLLNIGNPTAWQHKWQGDSDLLKQYGYKNLSHDGYVASIPETDYLFKISGPKHQVLSMLATKGLVDEKLLQDNQYLNEQVAKRLQGQTLPTYQTASRAAYYLLLKSLLEKNRYQHLRVPETFLLFVPGHDKNVSDGNVILVQKMVDNLHEQGILNISNGAIKELYEVIVLAGLWNVKDNLLVSKSGDMFITNGLHVIGFEEYPNMSSKHFFHKNKKIFDQNRIRGIKGLMDLFASDSSKIALIKELIENDNRLSDCDKSELLKD